MRVLIARRLVRVYLGGWKAGDFVKIRIWGTVRNILSCSYLNDTADVGNT